jgi:hypothetical protein
VVPPNIYIYFIYIYFTSDLHLLEDLPDQDVADQPFLANQKIGGEGLEGQER